MADRIAAPEFIKKAARDAYAEMHHFPNADEVSDSVAEAVCRAITDNSIVPTDEQIEDSRKSCNGGFGVQSDDFLHNYRVGFLHGADWAQRRMFLAQEPEMPEAVSDAIRKHFGANPADWVKELAQECFQMGRQSMRDAVTEKGAGQ